MIRPVRAQDAAALAAIDRRVVAAGRGVVRSVGQADDQASYTRRILAAVDAAPGERAMLVAEHDGAVVGEATISRYGVGFCRHVASLALQVDPDWQGRGIGRALMAALVDWGCANGIERMQLSVIGDNQRAIALYTAFGFAVEGCRSGFLLREDGARVDDLLMVRHEVPASGAKAAAIVLRPGPELLILVHPLAGWQLPKGTVEPGEDPAHAVIREVHEETGLAVRLDRPLGAWTEVRSGFTEAQRWHGFVVAAPARTADRWDHPASGSPEEDGLVFHLRWLPFDPGVSNVLPPQYHELVRRALAPVRR